MCVYMCESGTRKNFSPTQQRESEPSRRCARSRSIRFSPAHLELLIPPILSIPSVGCILPCLAARWTCKVFHALRVGVYTCSVDDVDVIHK